MKRTHFLVTVAAAAAASCSSAVAQTDAEVAAAGRACMSITSAELRLACFEGVFGVSAAGSRSEASETHNPSSRAAPVAATAAPASVAAGVASQERTGREDEAAPSSPELLIVEVREIRPGDARFVTDGGRVYVTTGKVSRSTRYPDAPFAATLESGALGSWFLRYGPESYERVRVSERE